MRERSLVYLVVVIALVLCFMFNVIILYDDLHQMDDPVLLRYHAIIYYMTTKSSFWN